MNLSRVGVSASLPRAPEDQSGAIKPLPTASGDAAACGIFAAASGLLIAAAGSFAGSAFCADGPVDFAATGTAPQIGASEPSPQARGR